METVGRYQIIRKLATGGMAEILLARAGGPQGFEKTFVLKRIRSELEPDPEYVAMFLQEARIAALMSHPNIAQTFELAQVDGVYFLVMEHVDGVGLRVLRHAAKRRQAEVPFAIAAKIISLAAEGLAYAHNLQDPVTGAALNLVHRDVSADNVLVSRAGSVKLIDFGIAKAVGSFAMERTEAGHIKGKIGYMAPEQVLGRELDRRVDIYALGILLYEFITGTKPFGTPAPGSNPLTIMKAIVGDPPPDMSSFRKGVPERLGRIVLKALEKSPEARYATCDELQRDLEGYLIEQGVLITAKELALYLEALGALTTTGPETLTPNPVRRPSLPAQAVSAALAVPAPTPQPLPDVEAPPNLWNAPTITVRMDELFARRLTEAASEQTPPPAHARPSAESPSPGRTPRPDERPLPRTLLLERDGEDELAPAPARQVFRNTPVRMWTGAVLAAGLLLVAVNQRASAPRPSLGLTAQAAAVMPVPAAKPVLKSQRLEVFLNILPASEIYVDGRYLGLSPLSRVPLNEGVHRLRVVNGAMGKDVSFDIRVNASSNIFKLDLRTDR